MASSTARRRTAGVTEGVGVGVSDTVGDGVEVSDTVGDGVEVSDTVGDGDGVWDAVGVWVEVGVCDGVFDGVGVEVGDGARMSCPNCEMTPLLLMLYSCIAVSTPALTPARRYVSRAERMMDALVSSAGSVKPLPTLTAGGRKSLAVSRRESVKALPLTTRARRLEPPVEKEVVPVRVATDVHAPRRRR
jgi:hypothetical protein